MKMRPDKSIANPSNAANVREVVVPRNWNAANLAMAAYPSHARKPCIKDACVMLLAVPASNRALSKMPHLTDSTLCRVLHKPIQYEHTQSQGRPMPFATIATVRLCTDARS